MIVYKSYDSFKILNEEINIISSETCYGLITFVEIGKYYHYMGHEPSCLMTAIFACQEFYKKDFSEEELSAILKDNKN